MRKVFTTDSITAVAGVAILMLAAPTAHAQIVRLTLLDGRQISVPDPNRFSSTEAEMAVNRIVRVTGLQPNIKVIPLSDGTVANAQAAFDEKTNIRYIIYNPRFLDAISGAGQTGWAATGALAHEIGHHLNGHTLDRSPVTSDLSHRRELDADEFAGVELARLGADLTDATAMLNALPLEATFTHPSRKDRQAAVTRGWCIGSGRSQLSSASASSGSACGAPLQVGVLGGNGGRSGRGRPAAPLSGAGTTIYSFDFTSPLGFDRSQFNDVEYETASYKYTLGGFALIEKSKAKGVLWDSPQTILPNPIEIEVKGSVEAGSEKDAFWGIGFGAGAAIDSSVYYRFLVSTDGRYALWSQLPASVTPNQKAFVPWTPSPMIRTGLHAVNTLAVRLSGTRVTLIVNSKELQTVDVGSFLSGRAMLFNNSGLGSDPAMTVVFYSLRASVPELLCFADLPYQERRRLQDSASAMRQRGLSNLNILSYFLQDEKVSTQDRCGVSNENPLR